MPVKSWTYNLEYISPNLLFIIVLLFPDFVNTGTILIIIAPAELIHPVVDPRFVMTVMPVWYNGLFRLRAFIDPVRFFHGKSGCPYLTPAGWFSFILTARSAILHFFHVLTSGDMDQ